MDAGRVEGGAICQIKTIIFSLADWVVTPSSTFFLPDEYEAPDVVLFARSSLGENLDEAKTKRPDAE